MIKKILGLFGVDSASGPFTTNLKFTSGGTSSSDVNTLDAYAEYKKRYHLKILLHNLQD